MDGQAIAFIRTNSNKWGFAQEFITDAKIRTGVPTITDIPVIACIGTSRDGKSTLLNALYKKISRGLATPFISKNGTEHVTNGIDYLIIPNKCMLLDCQGMAMKDAKYDHFLTLIIYHISNVIILNVRQQLDLQVLNNLLAVFSFLSEIPNEARRKDKPTLVIRLKDFQDMETYEKDKQYLNKYVTKWLTKSGDQYDHIKEAFSISFNIEIVVTEYPEFTNKRTKLIDIHDKKFFIDNPTYSDACDTIIGIAKSCSPVSILKNRDMLTKFIISLQQNRNIDYKKLDLYHNVTSLELEKYVNESLNIMPYNDESIIMKMDGSLNSYNLYTERMDQVNQLYQTSYTEKFKETAPNLKEEILGKWFKKFFEIIDVCKNKNVEMARDKIKPAYQQYNNKFNTVHNNGLFERLANHIIDIFVDHKDELYKQLNLLDKHIQDEITNEINKEKLELEQKQETINLNNEKQLNKITTLIAIYNPDKKVTEYLKCELQDQCMTNLNMTDEQTYTIIFDKIKVDLTKIHEENKILWYLNRNKDIDTCDKMKYDVAKYMPVKPKMELYWTFKTHYLTEMVFIPHNENLKGNGVFKSTKMHLATNQHINFVRVRVFEYIQSTIEHTYILMTLNTYINFYKRVIMKICDTYKFLDELKQDPKQFDFTNSNLKEVSCELPSTWNCKSLNSAIKNELLALTAIYAHVNNVALQCYTCL